jgi:hypothetical protein
MLFGDHATNLSTFTVPEEPEVFRGIGISVRVQFSQEQLVGSRRLGATSRSICDSRGLWPLPPLEEPPPGDQIAEDRDVSAVDQGEREVVPAQRERAPPAVLHNPLLEHALDRSGVDRERDPRTVRVDRR